MEYRRSDPDWEPEDVALEDGIRHALRALLPPFVEYGRRQHDFIRANRDVLLPMATAGARFTVLPLILRDIETFPVADERRRTVYQSLCGGGDYVRERTAATNNYADLLVGVLGLSRRSVSHQIKIETFSFNAIRIAEHFVPNCGFSLDASRDLAAAIRRICELWHIADLPVFHEDDVSAIVSVVKYKGHVGFDALASEQLDLETRRLHDARDAARQSRERLQRDNEEAAAAQLLENIRLRNEAKDANDAAVEATRKQEQAEAAQEQARRAKEIAEDAAQEAERRRTASNDDEALPMAARQPAPEAGLDVFVECFRPELVEAFRAIANPGEVAFLWRGLKAAGRLP